MRRRLYLVTKCCVIVAVCLWTSASGWSAGAQEKRPTQIAGVDNTRMGAYRALAELSFQAFQKGDNVTSAKLARILERTWDKGEEGGGKNSLAVANAELFEQIDNAMDAFIKPLMGNEKSTPDPAKIEVAYAVFLEKLKQAD